MSARLSPKSTRARIVEALLRNASDVAKRTGRADVAKTADLQVRRIVLAPNEELPFARTNTRAKVWVIISGAASADIGEQEMTLSTDAFAVIRPGMLHQIENCGTAPLVIIELSTAATGEATLCHPWHGWFRPKDALSTAPPLWQSLPPGCGCAHQACGKAF